MSLFYRPSDGYAHHAASGGLSSFSGPNELAQAGLSANIEASSMHLQSTHLMQPIIPGANEPISPIIQLIMRMPGQIGVMNSFFEALGKFFCPDTHFLSALDPALAAHAHLALNQTVGTILPVTSEHVPISLSLLPSDAPIFQILNQTSHGLATDIGNNISNNFDFLSPSEHLGSNMATQCSGLYPTDKVIFENVASSNNSILGEGLSSDTTINNMTSSYHSPKLFSDQITNQQVSSSIPLNSQISPNTTNSNLIAYNDPISTYNSDSGATSGSTTINSTSSNGHAPVELHAKELSLQSTKHHHSHVMDHIGYQTRGGLVSAQHKGIDEIAHKSIDRSQVKVSTAHQHIEKAYRAESQEQGSVVDQTPVIAQTTNVYNSSSVPTTSDTSAQTAQTTETTTGQASDTSNSSSDQSTGTTINNDAPLTTAKTSYTIRSNDCLWNIAKDHLGSPLRWQEIYKLNADVIGTNPDLIFPGTTLKLPGDIGANIASTSSEASKYIVQKGDTLWDIAGSHLSGGQNWEQIYNANTDVIGNNPNLIYPGQELTIPGNHAQLVSAPTDATNTATSSTAVTQTTSTDTTSTVSSLATSAPSATTVPTPVATTPTASSSIPINSDSSFKSESIVPSSLRPDIASLLSSKKQIR